MIFLMVRRMCNKALFKLHRNTWLVILAVVVSLYLGGLVGLFLLGESDVTQNYTWWFFVTITTVGYGDYAPATDMGRALAVVIMLVGIGTVGLVIGKVAEAMVELAQTKSKGMSCMYHEKHIVVMGYQPGKTEKVVTELLAHRPDQKIVLCANNVETNPLVHYEVDFVRGELASSDTLHRSNAAAASSVIVHGKDDNSTFFAAYALREVNTAAHLICYLADEDHVTKIQKLPANDTSLNQVVLPANVYLMAQEVQDRESSSVIHSLITNLTGDNLYRYDIPENDAVDCRFYDAFITLKKRFDITLIALKADTLLVNPGQDVRIQPGMSVFYTASARLPNIDFRIASNEPSAQD